MTSRTDSSQVDNMADSTDTQPTGPPTGRVLSGRWVVIGILVFAITVTGTMWVYWRLQDGPFIPLEQALSTQFKGSRPRVEGGQLKMHTNSPMILQITMKVDFDPTRETERFEAFTGRVARFTRQRFDVQPYQILEIHLFQPLPEKEIRQKQIRIPTAALLNSDRK